MALVGTSINEFRREAGRIDQNQTLGLRLGQSALERCNGMDGVEADAGDAGVGSKLIGTADAQGIGRENAYGYAFRKAVANGELD